MTLAYALPKTGHPNCRRPDKVIDAGQPGTDFFKYESLAPTFFRLFPVILRLLIVKYYVTGILSIMSPEFQTRRDYNGKRRRVYLP